MIFYFKIVIPSSTILVLQESIITYIMYIKVIFNVSDTLYIINIKMITIYLIVPTANDKC